MWNLGNKSRKLAANIIAALNAATTLDVDHPPIVKGTVTGLLSERPTAGSAESMGCYLATDNGILYFEVDTEWYQAKAYVHYGTVNNAETTAPITDTWIYVAETASVYGLIASAGFTVDHLAVLTALGTSAYVWKAMFGLYAGASAGGPTSSRPAAANMANGTWYNTTTGEWEWSNGVTWASASPAVSYPSGWYWQDRSWAAKPVSVAADRYTLLSPNEEQIDIDGWSGGITTETLPDLSQAATWDTQTPTDYTSGANRAGKWFYVYECEPENGSDPVILVSANSTYPSGYTADNSRRIVSFGCLGVAVDHNSTLTAWAADTVIAVGETRKPTVWNGKILRCVSRAGDYKTHATDEPNSAAAAVGALLVDDQVTWIVEQHALEGYVAGDILPQSVSDLNFRPSAAVEGMVYVASRGRWVDTQFQSGTGLTTASVYGATMTRNRDPNAHFRDFEAVGKLPIDAITFMAAAKNSNQSSLIAGGAEASTCGGHSDAYGRRMISDDGCEDMIGTEMTHTFTLASVTNQAVMGASATYPAAGNSRYKPAASEALDTGNTGTAYSCRGMCETRRAA